MSKVISRYLTLLREMHDIICNVQLDDKMKAWFGEIEKEYHKLADERGAIIEKITQIERNEDIRFLIKMQCFHCYNGIRYVTYLRDA